MSVPDSPERPVDEADELAWRSARRTLVLFVVAVAAAAVGLIAVLNGFIGEDSGDNTVGSAGGERTGVVTAIGPDAGTDVAAYVDRRGQQLLETEGQRAAVVSFTAYVTEDAVDDLLVDDVRIETLLLALPSGPSVPGDSVADARASAVAGANEQLEDISALVDTVEDPEFAEFYRAELLRYRALLDGADTDDVVHGAVVVGRAADLRAVASREGVRLVDVGDGAMISDDAALSGLRPEEKVTAGEPQFRP